MPHIFYAPSEPRQGPMSFAGYERWKANDNWATHAYNKIALTHIATATRDMAEKQQALAEIEIAEGKQTWWERHPNFEREIAMRLLKRVYGVSLG
jgi:hypothetical protein